jgi:hypothetical protein
LSAAGIPAAHAGGRRRDIAGADQPDPSSGSPLIVSMACQLSKTRPVTAAFSAHQERKYRAALSMLYMEHRNFLFYVTNGVMPVTIDPAFLPSATPSDIAPTRPPHHPYTGPWPALMHCSPVTVRYANRFPGPGERFRAGCPLAATGKLWKSGAMGGQALVCPRCGVGFDLPPGQEMVTGTGSTAGTQSVGSRVVSLQVDGVIVHQCQQRVDPFTGETRWRPARTVGADLTS